MGTFQRIYDPEYIHFVSNRCEHQMYLLLPNERLNEIILFWLAKAKQLFGADIDIYGFIFLSNHFHLFLKDPRGQLPRFMCYFQANVAKSVNRILNRNGRFWSREYDDVIVDGEDEFFDRFSYTVLNAVKSGLVAAPSQWKGVGSFEYMMEQKPIVATGLNLTKYNDAKRHGRDADKKDFEESYSFELATPPMLQDKPAKERMAFIKELMTSAMAKYKKDRLYKPALGMKKILQQNPFDKPKKSRRAPRFKYMSFCKARRKELEGQYVYFVNLYKYAVQALYTYFESPVCRCYVELKTQFPWPEGSYPPSHHRPVGSV
jgi:hypothetical protein